MDADFQLYRSMLFVPGNKYEWLVKAPKYGSDALIFDLEDAVPLTEKAAARGNVARALAEMRTGPTPLFVRVSSWGSGQMLADLNAIVGPGLQGVAMPKAESARDIIVLDQVLTELELERSIERGSTEIIPTLETAAGAVYVREIASASPRVKRVSGVADWSIGGDFDVSMGFAPPRDGDVRTYFSARIALEVRAAGIRHVIGGFTSDMDHDVVRNCVAKARAMGVNGTFIIHPGQVPVVHEAFGVSRDQVDEAIQLLTELDRAISAGKAATTFRGRMVDLAHGRRSLLVLEEAARDGAGTLTELTAGISLELLNALEGTGSH